MTVELVTAPEQVTPAWLSEVLRAAGELDDGRVTAVEHEAVGTGQVGDSVRFTIAYDGGGGPPTLVGKFPAADPTSRAAAASTRTYEVETRFYQQLRDQVAITTPHPYVALLDVETNEFVLLMNDLAPAVQGDQMAGCDVGAAALAMVEAAALHAPVWDDDSLTGLAWLNRSSGETRAFFVQLMGMSYPGFLDRYEDRLEPDVIEVGQRLVDRLGEYLDPEPGPQTAAHGDYRLDNMLFSPDGTQLTTVDWQTVALGPGVSDISYFLGTSLDPELRAKHERDLVHNYHEALRAGGVTDYPFDRCWEDYRRYSLSGLVMAILASMLVGRTDRGDEMFMAMANRSGRMGLELDALAFLR